MLIICEGEVTEPEYFALLRKISLEMKAWDAIEIRPKPKEDQTATNTPSTHKTPRPKRTFKNVVVIEDDDPILAEYDFKSQPISWVKEARDGLKDDTYDEVWAVFDFDGRTKTESAFKLAQEKINNKAVNIAFSSVAFEHWILLHFERNATSFRKSQCRNKKEIIQCGEGNDARDCRGAHCLIGYMRLKGYLAPVASTKKESSYSNLLNDLIQNRKTAYENVAWLRSISPVTTGQFPDNPYTNVDHLVQSMLLEEHTLNFVNFDQDIEWEGLVIKVNIEDKRIIFNLSNEGEIHRVLGVHDLHVEIVTDSARQDLITESPILKPNEAKEFSIDLPKNLASIVFYCKSKHFNALVIFKE